MTSRPRFDRTLRTVMWSDAFLSVAIVLVSVAAVPVLTTVGLPAAMRTAIAVVLVVTSVLLALFGAVTAVCLMLRMSDGDYGLPDAMRVPLPSWLRPAPLRSAWTRSSRS